MEKIKRDKHRVDISKLNEDEIAGDDLTGGYIFRIDRSDGPEDRWTSRYPMYGSDMALTFIYDTPDAEDIVPEQRAYLKEYIDDFEDAMFSPGFINGKNRHYTNYIDLASFVDNFIMNELSKDVDAYRLSTFFHKDKESKGGRIKAGPYWDFNLAFGNGDYCGGEDPTGWEYYQCVGNSPFWWDRWLQDDIFTTALSCRWSELRSSVLTSENINGFLDSLSAAMPDAIQRNFQRWPVLGTYVWPNSPFYAAATSHAQVMNEMKNWIAARLQWLDANMPGEARECETYLNYEHVVTSVDDMLRESISIFPNPSSGFITISAGSIIRSVRIYSSTGMLVFSLSPHSNAARIDLSEHIRSGLFLIRVETSGQMFQSRLVVE